MREDKKFDFLLDDIGTRELYARHRNDSPDMITTLRAGLRTDSRAAVRQNAIVALSASTDASVLDDFLFALGDTDPSVVSEAGYTVAGRLTNIAQAKGDEARLLAALRTHAPALRAAFASSRERVRFNVMIALEAISDPGFDLTLALRDEDSLIRSEGIKLAESRAYLANMLTTRDRDALVDFASHVADVSLRDDVVALLVKFAPTHVEPLIARAIDDGTVSYNDLKHIVEMQLVGLLPPLVAQLKAHPTKWSKEYLDILAAFNATCAAPLLADLLETQTDSVLRLYVRDPLATLAGHREWTDLQLTAWAKRQPTDVPPCNGIDSHQTKGTGG